MTRKRRRLYVVLAAMLVLSGAAALVLGALQSEITYFFSPTDLAAGGAPAGRSIRLGGLVEEGSVQRLDDGVTTAFRVTDLSHSVPVTYRGLLPDLFREGQGVVTEGTIGADGTFTAREVLAKHDETYMPREVADALKKSGQWRDPAETAK
ncbi:MAG TPA: cytochrome c maturation protein CcmE [Kiloniellales bacterium]|jgi:cytochrome c-type biogenesis protein CcmE